MSAPTKTARCICIHGHFYQPPRENPWLEAVEQEEGAAPFHDWNERITSECYAANTRSRIQDGQGRIKKISNNYEKISFNFGPTLLSWMEAKAGAVLRGIQQADLISQKKFKGHGNALAQAYNHVILPLADDRDRMTQIRWGKADFRKRFGRDPEGMWLPETAVDVKTLKALVQEGIKFTILAPYQAKRIRPLGQKEWKPVRDDLNPRRAYRCRLPGGQKIALFFFDGRLSHGIAFENYLQSSKALFQHLLNSFDTEDPGPQLVHAATDGESYGHHHAFGDMALAYTLQLLEKEPSIELVNYGYFLALHPPTFEVEIDENTSWSCCHGLGRWQENCGCRLGSEGQQEWRGPIREGLKQLKKKLDQVFEAQGGRLFRDPWEARDAYIEVVLDRSPKKLAQFFRERCRAGEPSREDRISALRLLEMQRHALLMFTSCGWFFDEISGLETTQILKYACRAIQLARDPGQDLEENLLGFLKQAASNNPVYGDGAGVWEKRVRPGQVDLEGILAQCAIMSLGQGRVPRGHYYSFLFEHKDQAAVPQNGSRFALGRLAVSSTITLEEQEALYAIIHFGGVDFQCHLKSSGSREAYETLKGKLLHLQRFGSFGDVYDCVKKEFQGGCFYIKDLVPEDRNNLIQGILQEGMDSHIRLMEEWVHEDLGTFIKLNALGVPLPQPMKMTLPLVFERTLEKGLAQVLVSAERIGILEDFFLRSQELGFPVSRERIWEVIQGQIETVLGQLKARDATDVFAAIQGIIRSCRKWALPMQLWDIQNSFLDACRELSKDRLKKKEIYRVFSREIEIPPEVISWEVP